MIKTFLVEPEGAKEEKKDRLPWSIKWKGVDMVRVHSLMASVKEILQMTEVLDVVKIGIIGDQSTGKSTLEDTLAHLILKMSKVPFAVRSFGEKEFLDMEKTLANLEPANYILKFRDLSFLTAIASKKQIDIVKQVVTKIRHLPGGKDVKIILIYDYHYTLALDKYLRQANFRYFTSVGSSETENMIKIVGNGYTQRITEFQKLYVEMTIHHTATFRAGQRKLIYNYKNPFVVCLFFNNARLRYVIFPLRQWIDPICSICNIADNPLLRSEVDLHKFREENEIKFGKGVFLSAVKLKLFTQGKLTYSNTVVNALKYLEKCLDAKQFSLEELATVYGLKVANSKLRRKMDGVMTEQKKS